MLSQKWKHLNLFFVFLFCFVFIRDTDRIPFALKKALEQDFKIRS